MTAGSNKSNPKKQISEVEDNKIPAPDGGYGWVVLIASFFVSFILDGVMYSFGLILSEIKKSTNTPDDVGNLLSAFNTGFLFCSGPIVAGLANQFGCRAVVMGGALVTSACYMLTVFSPNIYLMMVFFGVIGGVSTGCTYIASLIIIAEYFDKKRGIATGITMAGSGVGSFVFAPLISWLILKNDWKFAMSICACIILQSAVCGALLRPLNPTPSSSSKKPKSVELKNLNHPNKQMSIDDETFRQERVIQTYIGSVCSLNAPDGDKKLPLHQRNSFLRIAHGILKEMTDFKLLTQNFGFLLITASNFFLFAGYFTPFLYISDIAQENNIDKEEASTLISIIGIVNIPARMLYGLIADKRYVSPINLNTFSVAVATVPLIFFFVMKSSYWGLAVFSVLFAIGIAGMNSLTTMYLCDLVGLKKFSNATGIINLFRGFGCFLGPFVAGIVSNYLGKVKCISIYSAGCFIVGLVLSCLVSFGSLCSSKPADDGNETNETTLKTLGDSELNKNLLNNKE
ncbi:unnamed protein product [Brachionus calyciflorus]|uniref:Major facilitator superfamily (MFS) profile domain-containing protein n=1 Tax=Brachionus calyciflorus TaxID=104777 RepID=A0A814ACW1_9BILA|nr:unnamed protein product [Brachionus calyciflorus]